MQKIAPCLWFDRQAEEAVQFYTSLFIKSKILNKTYYGEGAPLPRGSVLTINFELEGQEFIALNGGQTFQYTPAISLFVNCAFQAEVDELWEKLSQGGAKGQCGWLTDKYGVSWQIVPEALRAMLLDKDPEKTNRVLQALLPMTKLDLATLQKAYDQA